LRILLTHYTHDYLDVIRADLTAPAWNRSQCTSHCATALDRRAAQYVSPLRITALPVM